MLRGKKQLLFFVAVQSLPVLPVSVSCGCVCVNGKTLWINTLIVFNSILNYALLLKALHAQSTLAQRRDPPVVPKVLV